MYIHTHIHTYIHACMHVCMYVCMDGWMYMYTNIIVYMISNNMVSLSAISLRNSFRRTSSASRPPAAARRWPSFSPPSGRCGCSKNGDV